MTEAIDVFPWNENFETGIVQIDEQHKVIVRLINQMATLLGNQSGSHSLDSIFTELTDYTLYHFESEEIIWERYLPVDSILKDHKQSHERFISEVLEIKAQEAHKSMQEVTEKVLSFLTHWLAFHILDSDMRMSKIILAMQSGMTMESAKQHTDKEMSGVMKVMIDTTLSMYDHLCTRTLDLKREINERKKIEGKLLLASGVFENTLEAICITDENSLIINANPAFFQSTGYQEQEVIGRHIGILKFGLTDEKLIDSIWQQLGEKDHWSGEINSRNKNGEIQSEWLALSTIRNEQNTIMNYIGIFSNISRLIKNQLKLEHIAHHDPLTGLPNRLLLADRLEQAIASAKRKKEQFAVCYLDLDGFKPVNDCYGHDTGDKLLCEISQRIKNIVRGNDTVARVGGDEFVVLFNEITSSAESNKLLARLLEEIAQPILIQNNSHRVSASIGVSVYPDDGNNAEVLLHYSDKAMYEAKRSGKSRYQMYSKK